MTSPTSIREAITRANLVLDEARAIQYTTPDSDGPFDGEDLEDPRLKSQLLLSRGGARLILTIYRTRSKRSGRENIAPSRG